MSKCLRCGRQYNEPADEQGDHDCPACGLKPEDRALYWWNPRPDEEDEEKEE